MASALDATAATKARQLHTDRCALPPVMLGGLPGRSRNHGVFRAFCWKGHMMRITRTLVTVCCVALAAFLGTGAFGQLSPNIGPKEPVSTQPSVNLTMADRHVLKETLLAQSAAKQDSAQVELELGRIVPAAVHLYVFPENVTRKVPRVRSYEFFVVEDVIVLVRPRDRMIVELVK